MSDENVDKLLVDKLLSEFRKCLKLSFKLDVDEFRISNPEQDQDDFFERLYFEITSKIKKKYQRRIRSLIIFIELNETNNKTTSSVSIIESLLEAVNQQVIKLIELNSTEENTSILSKIELVHKKLIELAEFLIERDIAAQDEVNILSIIEIEQHYLKLVGLVKSNLAQSDRTSVIFAIKVMYGAIQNTIIGDIFFVLRGNRKSDFAFLIKAQYQRLIELMELNLIEQNSTDFITTVIHQFLMDYSYHKPKKKPAHVPKIKALYQEILSFIPTNKTIHESIIITDKNLSNKNNSISLVKGIFLYTDINSEIVDYVNNHYDHFDDLTGDWCYIYVLEKKGINCKRLKKYWKELLLSMLHERFKPLSPYFKESSCAKPFNRNESYKIAKDLGIRKDQLPCIVFLPPLTEISGQEKLVIPVKEPSTKYLEKVFSTLESIVDEAKEQNKYEAIKVKFDDIIQYLENNSEKVVKQTTTEYQIHGTNIFVNSEIRRLNMTNENNPYINTGDGANINSVTGQGKIYTATQNQYNYPPEQKQNLAEAAKEIQQLLQQLSKPDYSATPTENAIIVGEVMQEIEKNPSLKSRIIEALKQGGKEAFKELIDHPAVNVLMASIDGWNNAE
ncbi:hypothetical protein [Okeania sp. KiyG1]|uniref:hypothetical protein n=1 Tax=Okeania sp. KiyG1 TaxID=2720165 RepID=UPI001924480D|nr:hypothetical protein [Okeania sp. KiyG1]GGA22442.1 hypothetical protein CYANOKiyG1_37570 [Okeania sp. KiyG1]